MSVKELYIGASGMDAFTEALSTNGDNIANSNTVGFKQSRATFEDVLARSVGGADDGLGVRLGSAQRIDTQGALVSTGVTTDLAISGEGFFAVKDPSASTNPTRYSRDGQFQIDKDGYLVNGSGYRVQGYETDVATGQLGSQATDLLIPNYELPPVATSKVALTGNLASDAVAPAAAWDVTKAEATSNFSTSMTMYDSKGDGHAVSLYFRRGATAGSWTWYGVAAGSELQGGTPTSGPTQIGTGTLTFDSAGRLDTEAGTISATFANSTAQTVALDFGDSVTTDKGSGLRGMTMYAGSSAINRLDQDGSSAASLTSISIQDTGEIQGIFSNGKTQDLGQVVIASFGDPQKLQRYGDGLYAATKASGEASLGIAGTGGRGLLTAGALERSNVDLSQEFVDMIILERGYQANARTISTADQILQEAVNLKR